jgi:hypothetical protein
LVPNHDLNGVFPAVLFSITLINIKGVKRLETNLKAPPKKRDIPMNQSVILKVAYFIHKVSDSLTGFLVAFFLLFAIILNSVPITSPIATHTSQSHTTINVIR